MIWNYIRDFLVQYIFGGVDSNGNSFESMLGYDKIYDDEVWSNSISYDVGGSWSDGAKVYLTIGDWLSTTTTIIIMCIAVFLMIMLVRWVWRLVTSAFLLK